MKDYYAATARQVFMPERHVSKWAKRFLRDGGVSLSQWDCMQLARKLVTDGQVASISYQTVGRILNHHRLKPWRHHLWLSPDAPRAAGA